MPQGRRRLHLPSSATTSPIVPRSPPSLVKPAASPSRICSPPLQDHGVSPSKTTPPPPVPLCSHPMAVPSLPITASPSDTVRRFWRPRKMWRRLIHTSDTDTLP